jgi:hypothetical protein
MALTVQASTLISRFVAAVLLPSPGRDNDPMRHGMTDAVRVGPRWRRWWWQRWLICDGNAAPGSHGSVSEVSPARSKT